MDRPLTWVVGAGGLLGGAVATAAHARDLPRWTPRSPLRWGRTDTPAQLVQAAEEFLAAAAEGPWQILWCAGAGVTATRRADLDEEVEVFASFLAGLTRLVPPGRASQGALFLASSAGGVYAGSAQSPRDERTVPAPLGDYGHTKLALEDATRRFAADTGVPVLVGRLANVYGPGQNLAKPQGLVSHIARAHLLGQPLSLYVPLDTVRDYLFVTDAARLVLDGVDLLRATAGEPGPHHVTKVLASRQAVTLGFLVAEFRRITRRRPRVVYAASPAAAYQARDLRVDSVVWPELDAVPPVPLPVGIAAVVRSLTHELQAGRLR